jgi:hypothetical protein
MDFHNYNETLERLRHFLKETGISVEIRPDGADGWIASFKPFYEYKERGALVSCSGSAQTPRLAIEALVGEASGRTLVAHAMSDNRQELLFPIVLKTL